MERSEFPEFNILEFSDYKNVDGQYTSQFIKSSRCVKINESDNDVTVAVARGKTNGIKILEQAHRNKEIKQIVVKFRFCRVYR